MERLDFEFRGSRRLAPFGPVIVGVLGSGNLEVLLESCPGSDRCDVSVATSAIGFLPIWTAVLQDFHERHALAGVRVSINDMGATPAVVTLRLEQALSRLGGDRP